MIFGMILDSNEQEEQKIRQHLRKLNAYYTDEKLELKAFQGSASFLEAMESADLLDVAVIDVTMKGALDVARQMRKQFARMEILVIADVSVSPMQYMHPSIRASALLLRPESVAWEDVIRDFYEQLPSVNEQRSSQENVLWIKNREGTFRIPFDQIYYLEAREKKVFVRTRQEEFGVGETMEKIAEQLPENFMKCHRSFIVNADFITKIRLSENLLYLGTELFVPVSRTYKEKFKRIANE